MSENIFSLRKLELSLPYVKSMEQGEPKAFANLLSIVLADEQTLKLVAAGSGKEALQVFIDKAYEIEPDEAAITLSNFTRASQRFSMLLGGCSIEVVEQMEKKKKDKLSQLLAE